VKLGILGGSFNPVHHGHLFLADTVISKLKLDRVIFIPAFRSPFKLSAEGVEDSSGDRLDMLAAAIIGDDRYTIDDCEIKREGVSYTIDTLNDIIERYMPDGKPVLIIGDDIAADFLKWKDSDKIIEIADIVIACRVNSSPVNYDFPHSVIDNDVMNISSQSVRQKIIQKGNWRSLVPTGVREIIEDRRLYGFRPAHTIITKLSCYITPVDIQRVEKEARDTLNQKRFLHSRNTAILSRDLCCRFGLDPDAGYLAGIAHDLCKQYENKHLIKIVKNTGHKLSKLEKGKPNLLHGKAATVLLRERFSIHNKDILEAVACHTSGSENMGPLAKVVYIADKTESSKCIDPVLRKMCLVPPENPGEDDLDSIFYAVFDRTVSKLIARKLDLSKDTIRLLSKMKDR